MSICYMLGSVVGVIESTEQNVHRALRELLSSCEGMLLEYVRRVRKMYLKLPSISIEIF